jgi:hypothetical protein
VMDSFSSFSTVDLVFVTITGFVSLLAQRPRLEYMCYNSSSGRTEYID